MTARAHGACGCVRHEDQRWTLCDDCSARIGKYGTCLSCGGPMDEQWTNPYLDAGEVYCSRECVARELYAQHGD